MLMLGYLRGDGAGQTVSGCCLISTVGGAVLSLSHSLLGPKRRDGIER